MMPLVFEPYLRPMVWGGRQLGEVFGKKLPPAGTYGESWEVSAHPLHVSRVAEGELQGTTLDELGRNLGNELFGLPLGQPFPLLIKLLDCRDLLSIQVHPSDELAPRLSRESSGKTEAWIVLDVAPSGRIFAGLKAGVGQADVERHLQTGTLEECLHAFRPRVGDCVFLPAGTVHAVGGGVVMAEVQQSSDATFRLYDWNRLGTDGQPRPLHIREALAAIDWRQGPVQPAIGKGLRTLPADIEGEELVRCAYFTLRRYCLRASSLPLEQQFSIWLVLAGTAQLRHNAGHYCRLFHAGETVLVPASCSSLSWHVDEQGASATLLEVTLPKVLS